jgi:GDP-L-fucose synthase
MSTDGAFDLAGKRVWVAGHRGMVGAALVRRLGREPCEILTVDHARLDLRRQADVEAWMEKARPDAVILAAAKVGGILANDSFPADFLYDNLMIEANVLEGARRVGVQKALFLGSSCVYPREAPQPMAEDALLTGPLEPTNQWYAIAKIAGLKLCEALYREFGREFISAMPTNMYGPRDNYDLQTSHVLPGLIHKFHNAKIAHAPSVTCWGTGSPLREFLHADDLASACVFLMENYSDPQFINIGSAQEITIRELAELIKKITGFPGEIIWDKTKPDGSPRKLMDSSRIFALGWKPTVDLPTGIRLAYEDFLKNYSKPS